MKKSVCKAVFAGVWISLLGSGQTFAQEWHNKLYETIPHLEQDPDLNDNKLTTASLNYLLNSSDKVVSAKNMNNAAGVMEFCTQQHRIKSGAGSVKKQMLDKLGLSDRYGQAQEPDYQQGVSGLLNTYYGQSLNLKSLSNSSTGEQLKTKVCDVIFKQSRYFITD